MPQGREWLWPWEKDPNWVPWKDNIGNGVNDTEAVPDGPPGDSGNNDQTDPAKPPSQYTIKSAEFLVPDGGLIEGKPFDFNGKVQPLDGQTITDSELSVEAILHYGDKTEANSQPISISIDKSDNTFKGEFDKLHQPDIYFHDAAKKPGAKYSIYLKIAGSMADKEFVSSEVEVGPVDLLISLDQLQLAMPNLTEDQANTYLGPLNEIFKKYQIDSPLRIAHFLAQVGHESKDFNNFIELGDDTYFEKYEPGTTAGDILGNTEKGDGKKFKGRGMIQLTGRWNYGALGKEVNVDFIESPEKLETPEYAVLASGWFWTKLKKINPLADSDDVKAVTKAVNGGLTNIEDRENRLTITKKALIH
jgi:putative chitinase